MITTTLSPTSPPHLVHHQQPPLKEQLPLTDEQRAQEVLKVLQAQDPYAPKAAVHFDLQQRGYRPAPAPSNLLQHYTRDGCLVAATKTNTAEEHPLQSPGNPKQPALLRNNFNFTDRGMHTTHLPPRSRATATHAIPRTDAATVCDAAAIYDVQGGDHSASTGQVLGAATAVVERLLTHNVHRELLIDYKVGVGVAVCGVYIIRAYTHIHTQPSTCPSLVTTPCFTRPSPSLIITPSPPPLTTITHSTLLIQAHSPTVPCCPYGTSVIQPSRASL